MIFSRQEQIAIPTFVEGSNVVKERAVLLIYLDAIQHVFRQEKLHEKLHGKRNLVIRKTKSSSVLVRTPQVYINFRKFSIIILEKLVGEN